MVNADVVLPNGVKMPVIGLGTWQSEPAEVKAAVSAALEIGYRHIDTAFVYMNETAIGEELEKWFKSGKLKREEVFITTKLPMCAIRASDVERYLKESLRRLRLDYVDLYLVHCPAGLKPVDDNMDNVFPSLPDGNHSLDMDTDLVATWKGVIIMLGNYRDVRAFSKNAILQAMEEQYDAGLARAIGISNFNPVQVEKIMKAARVVPATNQVELHAYFMQNPLRETCTRYGITVTSYASLGSPGRIEAFVSKDESAKPTLELLKNPIVTEIAQKHKKSNAQVLLRHLLQHNLLIIPKSVNPVRIKENFEIMDFKLDVVDMAKLDSLDKGREGRSFDFLAMKGLDKHPEYPFAAPH